MSFVAVFNLQGGVDKLSVTGSGPWLLGRGKDADIAFPHDSYCSRNQAQLRLERGKLILVPIAGASPLTVNGRAVAEAEVLRPGDAICFGRQSLIVAEINEDTSSLGRLADRPSVPDGFAEIIPVVDMLLVARRDPDMAITGTTICLDHPTVSRKHARFSVDKRGITITDLGSTNGTWVNGTRVSGKRLLAREDQITIGVFNLFFDGKSLRVSTHSGGLELATRELSRYIRVKTGSTFYLLKDISLQIPAAELFCIIGTSGSGKSALMRIISGRNWPSSGYVLLGDLDIHLNFLSLKQNIAYVPQTDELHDTLTLRSALEFAAKLRLPRDLSAPRRTEIIVQAAESVGLQSRLDVQIGHLSGGQKKRASLAREILSLPAILFLDEVTSGLDEKTDREIMALLRRMARRGMTVVCVTHTLANVEDFADKIAVLDEGRLVLSGAPKDVMCALNVQKLGEVFEAIESERRPKSLWPSQTGESQRARFRDYNRQDDKNPIALVKLMIRQLLVLSHRNLAVLIGDKKSIFSALIQSLAIGVLLGYAYSDFGKGVQTSNSKLSLVLVLGIVCLWIGCATSSKAIVGELPIFRSEHDINLSTLSFVISKFLVMGAFTIFQIALLVGVSASFIEALPTPPFEQFALAALTGLAGTALGLVISSAVNSRDQASVVVPLALAPQLILGSGLVTNLSSVGTAFAQLFIPAYWSREAMTAALISSQTGIVRFDLEHNTLVPVQAHALTVSTGALATQIVGWLTVTLLVMYWRYRRGAE